MARQKSERGLTWVSAVQIIRAASVKLVEDRVSGPVKPPLWGDP